MDEMHGWNENVRLGKDLLMDGNNTFVLNGDAIVKILVKEISIQ